MYNIGNEFWKDYQLPLSISSSVSKMESNIFNYKLIISLETRVSIIVDKQKHMLQNLSAIFLNEHQNLQKVDGKVYIIIFSPTLLNTMIEYTYLFNSKFYDYKEFKVLKLSQSLVSRICFLISKIEVQLKLRPDNYWPYRSKAYLFEILFQLYYPCNINLDVSIDNEDDLMEKIQYFINNHISEDININVLTKKFNINRTTLVKKFKDRFKITPNKYITSQRMELSKQILENTGIPIVEVSSKVGINSPAHFSKLFKANIGLTPSQFRLIYKKVNS